MSFGDSYGGLVQGTSCSWDQPSRATPIQGLGMLMKGGMLSEAASTDRIALIRLDSVQKDMKTDSTSKKQTKSLFLKTKVVTKEP